MEVKAGYKQTEVGVVPEDWVITKLSSLSKEPMQNGVFFEPARKGRGAKMINVGDLYTKVPINEESLELFDATENEISVFRVENGDLFFTRSSVVPSGIAHCNIFFALHSEPVVFDSHVIRYRPDPKKVSPSYLFRFCVASVARTYLVSHAKTGTMTTIDQGVLGKCPVVLPFTLAEQEAIAAALSDADALIEALEQLLAKKRQVKQGAMQELLSGKRRLVESGKWEKLTLGKLAKIQRGASPRPIDSPIWFDEQSSVGWVRISDVTKSGMYLYETTQRLSPLGVENSRPIKCESLIMSICATVGRPIITKIDTCIHDGFVVFDNLAADKHFLYYVLKSIEGDWSKHGQTGSQMNLNTELINRTEVSIPSTLAEQTAIAEVLGEMDAEIAALEEKLSKARLVKQGMMQELLTGKIRLNHD